MHARQITVGRDPIYEIKYDESKRNVIISDFREPQSEIYVLDSAVDNLINILKCYSADIAKRETGMDFDALYGRVIIGQETVWSQANTKASDLNEMNDIVLQLEEFERLGNVSIRDTGKESMTGHGYKTHVIFTRLK